MRGSKLKLETQQKVWDAFHIDKITKYRIMKSLRICMPTIIDIVKQKRENLSSIRALKISFKEAKRKCLTYGLILLPGNYAGLYKQTEVKCKRCKKAYMCSLHDMWRNKANGQRCQCKLIDSAMNKTFGKLTVIGLPPNKSKSMFYVGHKFLCKCLCGRTLVRCLADIKREGKNGCPICKRKMKRKKRHGCYMGIGRSYWYHTQMSAKRRNLLFDITIKYAWDLYKKQNKKCALSGIDIPMGKEKEMIASLDRINSRLGYVKGNVQWVHKVLNELKMDHVEEEFINWCKLVAKYNT